MPAHGYKAHYDYVDLTVEQREGRWRLILRDQRHGHPLDRLEPVVALDDLRGVSRAVEHVYIDELLQRWIVRLVRSTRDLEILELPASVRGTLALERAVRAWALLDGRDHVIPEDVEALFPRILAHRVLFTTPFIAATRNLSRNEVLQRFWECCLELAPRPH